MAWPKTGTVSVTNGSAVVTGTGTSFFGSAQAGWGFVGPDGRVYEVLTADSPTQITLASNYQGATAAGQVYSLFPTMSLAHDLVSVVQTLISNYQTIADGPGSGKFATDVVKQGDEDTGLAWPASNTVVLKAGGAEQLRMTGGVASGAAVQSSVTDGTIGKLLKFGAFGLGVADGMVAPDVVDMDTAPTGFGRISGATVGSKPPGVTSGTVFTGVNQAGRTSQLVFRAASNRVYVRTKHDNVWRVLVRDLLCREHTWSGLSIRRFANRRGD
ncbi:hypothetical protein [Leisingera aquaemixtae]|uniref:Uncharacterized protein n=1 Tax=Leisingera aquaemixtae TaxID=1396826 RepID=A0A0P1H9X4_9RHOB|nr:hypothetical protein [Leisingera aquaemixtae]CUH99857.1 hypothetical protein PHA8399_01983 [Leisingera aquaemixtae]